MQRVGQCVASESTPDLALTSPELLVMSKNGLDFFRLEKILVVEILS